MNVLPRSLHSKAKVVTLGFDGGATQTTKGRRVEESHGGEIDCHPANTLATSCLIQGFGELRGAGPVDVARRDYPHLIACSFDHDLEQTRTASSRFLVATAGVVHLSLPHPWVACGGLLPLRLDGLI